MSEETNGTTATDSGWAGDSPFYLVIELEDRSRGNVGIDLDEGGWLTSAAEHLRSPGIWWLVMKANQAALLSIVVEEGEQPYFTRHHVGDLMGGHEVVAFGIGKKLRDGSVVRLWALPNGVICGGDDVDTIAARML